MAELKEHVAEEVIKHAANRSLVPGAGSVD
jgi:hypothetical protein